MFSQHCTPFTLGTNRQPATAARRLYIPNRNNHRQGKNLNKKKSTHAHKEEGSLEDPLGLDGEVVRVRLGRHAPGVHPHDARRKRAPDLLDAGFAGGLHEDGVAPPLAGGVDDGPEALTPRGVLGVPRRGTPVLDPPGQRRLEPRGRLPRDHAGQVVRPETSRSQGLGPVGGRLRGAAPGAERGSVLLGRPPRAVPREARRERVTGHNITGSVGVV
mmetsp:Transcript_45981/g.111979  ORF Transcript_45981/g.111979 Transcript_45981/m.111979 type:complete len:216 (-) Transcript_45981:146-793(-)